MPAIDAGFPSLGIFCEHVRLVVLRVERDAQENKVLPHAIGETFLQSGEVVREPKTIIRQGTARVNESDRDNLAAKLGERHVLLVLIDQRKIWNHLAALQERHKTLF